jgi:hypothetical protein
MPIHKNLIDRIKKNKITDLFGVTSKQVSSTPQKNYLWEVHITNGGIVPVIGTLLDNIKVYAKNVNVPNSSIEPIEMNFMGERIFYSGKENSSHTVQMTFWDDESGTIRRYMNQWYQLVHENYSGKSVSKINFQRTVKIRLKDNSDTIYTGVFELEGAFPIEIGDISLSYDSSDIMEIPITLQYDTKTVIT